MKEWLIYALLYPIFNGIFNSSKKKASEKNNIYEILAIFTSLSFVIVTVITRESVLIDFKSLSIIFIKSVIIAISWILNLYVIKRIALSLYGIIKISSIIFVEILSVIILKEVLTIKVMIRNDDNYYRFNSGKFSV